MSIEIYYDFDVPTTTVNEKLKTISICVKITFGALGAPRESYVLLNTVDVSAKSNKFQI